MTRPILLVEDTSSLRLVYEAVLRKAGHDVVSAADASAATIAFRRFRPSVVLLDLVLPDRDGLELIPEILARAPETRIVVITAHGSINRAVEAMRAGAFEFLVKPFDEERLLGAIRNALRTLPPDPGRAPARGFEPQDAGFIGSSPAMRDVYARIAGVARSMATVFISGESGTGKEICAQAIHRLSDRAPGPFVPLNCGAIPADLLESEVFGHLKGSFTGAISDKQGAAAAADGGTLFLDEICEMDLNLQTKLLRFVQTSSIQPVGAVKARNVDVRIVCATNRDPFEEVRLGRFREDLFYRLHVVPIRMPALRERGDDVIEIAEQALAGFGREEGKHFAGLSEDVRDLFRRLPWPGNVRQLLNVLRNIVVLNDGPVVTKVMLPIELLQMAEEGDLPEASPGRAPVADGLIGMTLHDIERVVIERTIEHCGGSIPRAARMLAVSPSTIYRKMESWKGSERPRSG